MQAALFRQPCGCSAHPALFRLVHVIVVRSARAGYALSSTAGAIRMSEIGYALGRALMSVIFIISGYNKVVAIGGFVGYLTRLGVPSPEIIAWVVAVFELVAGIMLLVGFKTRWAALGLFIFTGIALYLGHKFWAVPPQQFSNQFNHALKNVAMMGGFLLLMAHGGGRLSLDGGRD
ncbi:MAG TPA: DoxX family protein [Xanthobacteraceae bacterium]|nr:DoxX family protein [Xanthobacteraceae bacterium]